MKKFLIISALGVGLMFSSFSKGFCQRECAACYGSFEGVGGALALNLANNPFGDLTSGIQAILGDFFGPNLSESMSAFLADSIILESMNSATAPFGGKLIAQGPAKVQNEFSALNLRAKVLGLEGQAASGSTKTWTSLTGLEKKALRTDKALSLISGF